MSWYKDYKLSPSNDGYSLTIYIDDNSTEFSKEFFDNIKENVLDLDDDIQKFIKEKFPDIKINSVKLMLGALVIGSIPFMAHTKVAAADVTPTTTTTTQTTTAQLNTIGTVTVDRLNVRQTPSTTSTIVQVILKGNVVKVLSQTTGWYNVQLSDGTLGWVSSAYLSLPTITPLSTTGTVTSSNLNVRQFPLAVDPIIHTLWQGNSVKVIGSIDGWYRIQLSDGRIGWVSSSYLSITDPVQQKIDIVISQAKALLGTPYVWGGESLAEGGFDCSGFTQYVFGKAGYTLNRISRDQATQGTAVSMANLKPGDLVFYSFDQNGIVSHVGIYLGNGQMIHSPKTGDVVKITDMTTSYWQSRFITGRRIIQ